MLNFLNRNRCGSSFVPIYHYSIILLMLMLTTISQVNGQTVTLKTTNSPIIKIFAEIKKQTGYRFFYDADLLDRGKSVSVDVVNQRLEDILDLVCRNQPFTYSVQGKIITIMTPAEKRKFQSPPKPIIEPGDERIQGRVTNSSGNPMEGVTIMLTGKSGRRNATATAADGSFELEGQQGDLLTMSYVGLETQEIRYKGVMLNIIMQVKTLALEAVQVSYDNLMRKKIPWTDTIDLRHRSHMNLGQVLQGTIPGLTLQNSSRSQTGVAGYMLDDGTVFSMERMKQLYDQIFSVNPGSDYHDFESWLEFALRNGIQKTYSVSTQNSGLLPQLRGVSGFNGNTAGMLIVIDGFIQDGFPADYPVANIESIKVIKDPEELTKWGPKASGGVILITSKKGVAGKLDLSYTTNMYYSPAPRFNRRRQQLASTSAILDYQRQSADSGLLFTNQYSSILYNRTPAELLLYGLKSGTLPEEIFLKSWDSLSTLDNEEQLQLLQQNAFGQNHILRLSGGNRKWNFSATGSFGTDKTVSLGSKSRAVGVNVNNNFLLFKDRLKANLQVILNRRNSRIGTSMDPQRLQPYQLLVGDNGQYIYDYSRFNPTVNDIIERYGYENAGVNMLEDARVNYISNEVFTSSSRLNLDWDLLPGLQWSNSIQYERSLADIQNYRDASSSQARQKINEYGSPQFNSNYEVTGVNFYVPKGGILDRYFSKTQNFNLRSALIYSRQFGEHTLSGTIGGGGVSNQTQSPAWSTLYGYNQKTGSGLPVQLPVDPTYNTNNYLNIPEIYGQSSVIPYLLLAPNAATELINRSVNWNGNFHYDFAETIEIEGGYSATLIPSYGTRTTYSTLQNYNTQASYQFDKKPWFALPTWLTGLSVATGVEGMQIPGLPEQISGNRTLQPGFGDFGIWVNQYNLVQQTGQQSRNIYQKLSFGLADNQVAVDITYNSLDNKGLSGLSKTAQQTNYLGATVRLKMRKNLLNVLASTGKSPEGKPQSNLRAAYDIARETWFKSKSISTLSVDATLRNISSYQGIQLMASTNAPLAGGGFSPAINTNFGLLPPAVNSFELHGSLGMLSDKYRLDLRFYNRTTEGLNNGIPVPTDPSTGLSSQVSYSKMQNKGVEVYLIVKAVERNSVNYTITLNGAYNRNVALDVPNVNFSQSSSYLTAYRNGYGIENIWSYRWAGLNDKGSPQLYDGKGQKTSTPDSTTLATALIYNGVTRAPYTGGFINEFTYKDFFARMSILFNLGHVMRQYIPSPSGTLDNSSLIADRWRQPGDENHTSIAAMANTNAGSTRTFIIQNADNSIVSAAHIRLQEVQIGWQAPKGLTRHVPVKDFSISLQARNLALWTHNSMHIDPETVSSNGFIGFPLQRQFSLTLNMRF